MFEMPVSDKYHSNACRIASFYGISVSNRAARLNNRGYTRFYTLLYAIGEREKRVGSHNRTFRLSTRVSDCLLSRPDSVRLSHTDTRRPVALSYDNGVGFGVFYDFPVKEQSFYFFFRGSAFGDYA